MQQKEKKSLLPLLVMAAAILGGVWMLAKSVTKPEKKVQQAKKAMQSTKRPISKVTYEQLEKAYEGITGFGIPQEESDFIKSKGGAPTYGEIIASSMNHVIEQLKIQDHDVFYDLGSGVGKFVAWMHLSTPIQKSVGIELAESRYKKAKQALRRLKASRLVDPSRTLSFVHGDITKENLHDATVIFMCATCFSEDLLTSLVNKFVKLKPGLRIVTLKDLPKHPKLKLYQQESLPTSWSEGSPFYYYELLASPESEG